MINTFAFVRRLVRNFHPENYGRAGGKPRLYAQTLYRGKTHLLRIVLNRQGWCSYRQRTTRPVGDMQ